METHMTSVERVLEYAKLPPEKSTISKNSENEKIAKVKFSRTRANEKLEEILNDENTAKKLDDYSGDIRAEKFEFNYFDGGPTILRGISLDIKPAEKIGIVGRTGAGKSSFISAIFRMRNGFGGSLFIHGKPANEIPLSTLRRSISIIPQDPIIFSDSVRNNLGLIQKKNRDTISRP